MAMAMAMIIVAVVSPGIGLEPRTPSRSEPLRALGVDKGREGGH